jgi:hypothetical protein
VRSTLFATIGIYSPFSYGFYFIHFFTFSFFSFPFEFFLSQKALAVKREREIEENVTIKE